VNKGAAGGAPSRKLVNDKDIEDISDIRD